MQKIKFLFFMIIILGISTMLSAATLNVPAIYPTIKDAVTAANSGDIIVIAAGSYADKYIVIDKSLTLQGANAGIPGTDGARGPETILSGGYYVISPKADDITIDGIKIISTGGRIIDTYADANNFHLTNTIIENTAPYLQQGVIQFGSGSHVNMTLDYNYFNYGSTAMLYFGGGPYTNLHISNNHFSGLGDGVFWAAQALSGGLIENNIFNQSVALNIGQGGDLKIKNNTFDGCYYTAFQVGLIGGQITGNTFKNLTPYSGYWGDTFQLWGGEWGTAVSANVLISNNTIYYNNSSAEPIHGPRLRGEALSETITFRDNDVFDQGIGTNARAVRNHGTGVLDVTQNYWGSAAGIEDVNAEGPVVICPWYVSDAHAQLAGPCLVMLAAFTADTTWGVGQLCVQFTNMSDNADSCYWEFGDGEVSSETNPMHCYGTVRKYYTVKLTVFGELGEPEMMERANYIIVHKAAAANFNASPLVGLPGTEVQFVNNCGGNIQRFCWDFGDGEKAGFRHGTMADEKVHPTHVYAEAGAYSVTLATAGLAGGDTITIPNLIYIDENYQPLKLESGSDTHPDYGWDKAIDHDVLSTNCKVQAMNADAQAVFAFTDDAKKVVNKVRLMANTALRTTFANHLIQDFAIEVSVDGTNWETAFEGTITERYDWQVFEFDGAIANFVKLILKSARGEGSPWVSLSEFQVFGTPSESIALNKDGVTDFMVTEYALAQNYPNPFNPSTTISFSLPQAGNVTLSVFNVCGQEVASLVSGTMSAGMHQVEFDARNMNSGTYFYKIEAGSYQAVRRMILVK